MKTAIRKMRDIMPGDKVLIHEPTLWGDKYEPLAVSTVRCSVRDRLVELEFRQGQLLKMIMRHSPDVEVRVVVEGGSNVIQLRPQRAA